MLVCPSLLVTEVAAPSVPEPAVRAHATVTPDTPLPNRSVTRTTNGAANARRTVSACPLPETTAIAATSPAIAVAGMLTLNPAADAAKLCAPSTPPSVMVVDARPCASVVTLVEPTLPPAGGAKFTVTPPTPNPSDAVTRTTAGWLSAIPALPVCPPPLTSEIPVGGSDTVSVASSWTFVGALAVIVAVPRLLVVVTTPVFAFTAATAASELDHTSGTFGTTALFASNAVAVKAAPNGAMTFTVFGAMTTRVAVAPGPTYLRTISGCCRGASPGGWDGSGAWPWNMGTPGLK